MTVTNHFPAVSAVSKLVRTGLVGAVALLMSVMTGCGQGTAPPAASETLVLTDPRSGAIYTASLETSVPAEHPQTGQPTLVRALYCPKCQTWHPVPPAEVLQRNPKAGRCLKTGSALQPAGPIPPTAIPLPASSTKEGI